ncbi:MAG: histidine kinase N-terminal 7TM domain-containing protein, partial [Anaerolineaceae bacterium]
MEHLKLPIALLVIAITIDLYIALLAWRRRNVSGGLTLFLLMLAVTEWTVFVLVELLVQSLPLKILAAQFSYIGSQTTPVLFLLTVFTLTNDRYRLQSRFIPFLFVVPFLAVLLAFTNQNHGLIWTSFTPYPGMEGVIRYGHGPLFWVLVLGYSYLCMLVGVIEIISTLIKRRYTYRWQAVSMLAATLVPWIGHLLFIIEAGPFPGIDTGPIPFSLVGIIIAFSIYQFRLLDISPVARDVLFETMIDSLIVLDPKDRIIDINPAGQQLLGAGYEDCIGISANSISSFQLIEVLRRDPGLTQKAEILWGKNQERVLDLTLIPIKDKKNRLTGRLVVVRDITEAQIMEDKLQHANETLKEQLDQIKALQETLREQTIRDPLTGLYNRRFLDDMLALQISQAKQENTVLSIVMIDLDRFK